ncbi:MAG TPA: type II toxin-antitoxin system Phd/YefM family antitoxin [Candidatus Saccharimonadia bacterium]|jgi:antitoxin Phd|nr:type II toxin-antitoxin system Phd/YefM family antitoxin [Candidatus Saccharimonadia bacterium]
MKEMSSTDAKTHFGALIDMAQREPVAIHKKGRAVAVMLSMQDFEEHEAMKFTLLQQAIDAGIASGISDQTFAAIIAEAEADAVREDDPAGYA